MECPVCCCSVPPAQLEKHVNDHLDDQQIERDEELAKDVAAANSSPTQCVEYVLCTQGCDRSILLTEWETHCLVHELGGRNIGNFSSFWLDEQEKLGSQEKREAGSSSALSFDRILASQRRDAFLPIQPGLISALKKCLLAEGQRYSRYAITSYIDHFQSTPEDFGWGCGWRNIQMLSSFLLNSEPWRKVLFGSSGFVPTVSALQQWLELAWSEGFDPSGAEHFNWRIHGSRKWIGTTECAAILRFFGLYAQIADFKGVTRKCGGKLVAKKANLKKPKVRSAKFLHLDMEVLGTQLATKKQPDVNSGSSQQEVAASDAENVNHQRLVDWVWNYYTEAELSGPVEPLDNRSASPQVVVSGRPPLYFQHQGHSRTIVGIQRRKQMADGPEEAFLLILDPSQRTEELAKALRSGQGWQKLIKRGVHTLKKAEYQLCYVEPGIACGEDREQLKILTSMSFLY